MWHFEEYIRYHKIAVLGVVKGLADQYDNIDYWPLYRHLSGFADKELFKLYEHLPHCWKKHVGGDRWYGDWKYNVSDYDTVIIGNGLRGRDLIEYIQDRNPKVRIIVHFESLIGESNRKDPVRYKGLKNLEFSTFDKGDSEKWGIRHIPFYYDPRYYDSSCPALETWKKEMKGGKEIRQDVFFVGSAFDRAERLVDIHKIFLDQGVSDKMVIVKNPHRHYGKTVKAYLTEQRMTYTEVLQEILQSRCVLEVLQEGQQEKSLRPMEAAIFQKKLITDNPYATDYESYTPENVFIIGVDKTEKLKQFVYQPCRPISETILLRYTPQYWLESLLFGRDEAEQSIGFDIEQKLKV